MPKVLILTLLMVLFFTSGCSSLSLRREQESDAHRAAVLLTGWFDSVDQAMADPKNFYPIRLILVPIWTDLKKGRWLYVEQASFESLQRPYRQRVQHVFLDQNSQIRSDVYLLPGIPQKYAGAWKNPSESFKNLQPDDLTLREGCSVLLRSSGAGFVGGTLAEECSSTLGGASYATSEVELTEDLLISWDRGWDSEGNQVWGATREGYRFIRRGLLPPENNHD